jgi:hypothetical protein
MPLPEEWRWLDEVPEMWEPPDGLRSPVRSIQVNLAITLLSFNGLGLEIQALVGRFVTEWAAFNMWFLREAKRSGRDEKELLQLTRLGRDQARLIYESWERFRESVDMPGDDAVVSARVSSCRAALAQALRDAVAAILNARGEVQ